MRIVYMATDNRQSRFFRLHRENGTNDYLFVHFRSPAKLLVGHEYVNVCSGACVLFDKHAKQSYFSTGETEFFHDFMHFDTESESEQILIEEIPKNTVLDVLAPTRITESLQTIENNKLIPSLYERQILTALCVAFVWCLRSEMKNALQFKNHSKQYMTFYNLRRSIYDDPCKQWEIEKICSSLYISRSYFHHLYKAFFATSCIEDVTRARIDHSKVILSGSDLSISEVAAKCGYNSTEHYIRQFKKMEGITPHAYRSSMKQ